MRLLRRYFLACRHDDTSSLRLFKVAISSADNEIHLPQAQVASFGNRVIRGDVFQDLPTDLKIYVRLLQFPNMLSSVLSFFF